MRVLTTGCFGIVGPNHRALFAAIKQRWPDCELVVGLNGDHYTKQLKEQRREDPYPTLDLCDRMAEIADSRCVDRVCVFEEDTPSALILLELSEGDVFCKGPDWKGKDLPEAAACRAVGATIAFIDTDSVLHATDIAKMFRDYYADRLLAPHTDLRYSYPHGETDTLCSRCGALVAMDLGVDVRVTGPHGSHVARAGHGSAGLAAAETEARGESA